MTRIGLSFVAVVFFTAAMPALSQPPPELALFGAANAQPVAGRLFTGLSIVPQNDRSIATVSCAARLGRKVLRANVVRFHLPGNKTPMAVTCGWMIPAGAHGKTLSLSKEFVTTTDLEKRIGPTFSWRIR
jgi:hypothetical protein